MKLTKEQIEKHKKAVSLRMTAWSADEEELMQQLIDNGITNGRYIAEQDLFPGRSVSAIQTKMSKFIHAIKRVK